MPLPFHRRPAQFSLTRALHKRTCPTRSIIPSFPASSSPLSQLHHPLFPSFIIPSFPVPSSLLAGSRRGTTAKYCYLKHSVSNRNFVSPRQWSDCSANGRTCILRCMRLHLRQKFACVSESYRISFRVEAATDSTNALTKPLEQKTRCNLCVRECICI